MNMGESSRDSQALRDLLVDSAKRIFADHNTRATGEAAENGTWPARLWEEIEAAGLSAAARSTDRGGVDTDFADVAALVRVAGRMAVPLPLAETFLAEQLLAAAGLASADGPATVGPVLPGDAPELTKDGASWRLDGTLHRVPWARDAGTLVVLAKHGNRWATVRIDEPRRYVTRPAANVAREPRDTVRFDNLSVDADRVSLEGSFKADQLLERGAFFRCLQMAGALEEVLELTVRYANERVQFGKPIGKFQAVQHQAAVLASHAAASSAAAHGALEALRRSQGTEIALEVMLAKIRIGEASGIAAAIAHQVHGAMGFTYEHVLHRSTRRLWSWRDEFGAEAHWAEQAGRLVSQTGGEGLWAYLTSPRDSRRALGT